MPWRRFLLFWAFNLILFVQNSRAIGQDRYVDFEPVPGEFGIVQSGGAADLYVDSQDFTGVLRAAGDLKSDVARVTGVTPAIVHREDDLHVKAIIIGTLGRSRIIDQLIREGRLNVAPIAGKWEAFIIQVVPNPMPGVASGLVIAGSDKRGTIFGIYDLSEQIGVSPWYWWADVPATHRDALFVKPGPRIQGPPAVKYRGIFLNDEAPDLTNWIKAKFGTIPPGNDPPIPAGVANYNHQFYEKIFEVILRLKGNYLWPAMWDNAFNEDDPANPRLADEFGVVMGTSHQEPMLRAQKEWDRRYKQTLGYWNYGKHPDILTDFWREGIRRNKGYESIITIGLRGADDTPMAPGGPEANRAMLEQIVEKQRSILAEEINPDPSKVPQLWCLYKEVQEFYGAGMQVPEDVTLLWAEDNWGNVRRLPTAAERRRNGGAGIYYHFDYHGGPRSYQWLNTNPIAKIWDQLALAKQYGADRIWIVNVGHFKGYEFPLEYFMHLAWDTNRWTSENLADFTRLWAAREFGPGNAADIADIIAKCTKWNGRCKPELLRPDTYSLVDYHEEETVVADFKRLSARAEEIYGTLPPEKKDAFYELVLFPAKASALVNELYFAAGKNALYARQGRASTNDQALETRALFQAHLALMDHFNRTLAGGKWDHFMDQPVIGYTTWRDPPANNLDAIKLTEIPVPAEAAMGLALEGSENAWLGGQEGAVLPKFDAFNRQRRYIEVFNRGREPFEFTAAASAPWIMLSDTNGTVEKDRRLWVSVDWSQAPKGAAVGTVTITGAHANVSVKVEAFNPVEVSRDSLQGFVEGEGVVAIEAEHYSRNIDAGSNRWIRIDDYGHTLSAMRATAPVDAPSAIPGTNSPRLEYQMYLFDTGTADVTAIVAPTLNFIPGRGLKCALSFDDEVPQIITLVPGDYKAANGNKDWEKSVALNARFAHSTHPLAKPGYRTLKFWMIDPGVVLEKLVVNLGGLKPSYLGPPESFWRPASSPESAAAPEGVHASGHYRNLFSELLGRTGQEIEEKLQAAWQQLFYGRDDTQRVYFPVGADMAYIADTGNSDVRTEGISYGMMIAVQLNHREEFDRLWKWARTYMYHAEGPRQGFFAWHCAFDGRQLDPGSASDGEEWITMALFFAANRWGCGSGIFNYRAEAARASRALFRQAANPRTGLMPDYAGFDGQPHEARGHDDFRFDAWRTLANVAIDHAWFAADPWQVGQSNRVLAFLAAQGPFCPNQFTLDGKPLSTEHSLGLDAMAAVAGLAADPEQARPFVQRLWDAPVPTGQWRYYDGMLYLLGLLQASGRFQIFSPPADR